MHLTSRSNSWALPLKYSRRSAGSESFREQVKVGINHLYALTLTHDVIHWRVIEDTDKQD